MSSQRHRKSPEGRYRIGWLRSRWLPLLVVFVASRLLLGWLALNPDVYGPADGADPSGELDVYRPWAQELRQREAYTQVDVEYPPGLLAFVVAPGILPGDYATAFVVVFAGVDVLGLIGLVVMTRRTGIRRGTTSLAGLWLWTLAIPLLGPISYVRLDLVPVVAGIWAAERFTSGDELLAGGALGVGAAAKLYPALLIPAFAAGARRAWRLLGGVVVAALAVAVRYLDDLGALLDSVLGYHVERGIQLESLWATGLLVLGPLFGHDAQVTYDHQAFHLLTSLTGIIKPVAAVAAAAVVAGAVWLTVRAVRAQPDQRDRVRVALAGSFATLAGFVAVATVLSPQYILWLAGPAAVVLCLRLPAVATAAWFLLPLAVLTQAVYPFAYDPLIAEQGGALALQTVRNLGHLLLAVVALASLASYGRPFGFFGESEGVRSGTL